MKTVLPIAVFAALCLPCRAGDPLPSNFKADPEAIRAYKKAMDSSASLLFQLNAVLEAKHMSAEKWREVCDKAFQQADALDSELEEIHKRKRPADKGESIRMALAGHRDSWERVAAIGGALAAEHDRLLDAVHLLEIETQNVRNDMDFVKAVTPAVDAAVTLGLQALAAYVGMPAADVALDVKNDLLDNLEEAFKELTDESLKVGLLAKLLVRKSDEVMTFRRRFDDKIFKSRVDEVMDKQIEPDTSSLFHKCEQVWEKKILDLLKEYQAAYATYFDASQPAAQKVLYFQASVLKSCTVATMEKVFGKLVTDVQEASEALTKDVEDDE